MINFLIHIIFIFFVCVASIFAQSGSTFKEFSLKLQPYFDEDFISDIQKVMPQGSDYKVWSWDVGDFSGDGNNDVALVVKSSGEKRKLTAVYLFVDINGYLTNVGTLPYNFLELPLEVGVVIKKNICFVTRKREQFSWLIRGYTFDNGSLILADEFTTSRISSYTRETYRNFINLESKERLIETNSGSIPFDHKYLSIPAYSRGRQIFRGYAANASVTDPDFVMKGAYYWTGIQDCSFDIQSVRYDEEYLFLTINIHDDKVITGLCDTCTSDFIDIWFHPTVPANDISQYLTSRLKKKVHSRTKKVHSSDTGLVRITIKPGDFIDKYPYAIVESSDETINTIKDSNSDIRVISNIKNDGYSIKARIPLSILGIENLSSRNPESIEIGCSFAIHDSDNKYRPEEETVLATSRLDEYSAATYGTMLFIPDTIWYGETSNLYTEPLLTTLHELGF